MSEKSIPQLIAGWQAVADAIDGWLNGEGLASARHEHALVYGIAAGLRIAAQEIGGPDAPHSIADLAAIVAAADEAHRTTVQ